MLSAPCNYLYTNVCVQSTFWTCDAFAKTVSNKLFLFHKETLDELEFVLNLPWHRERKGIYLFISGNDFYLDVCVLVSVGIVFTAWLRCFAEFKLVSIFSSLLRFVRFCDRSIVYFFFFFSSCVFLNSLPLPMLRICLCFTCAHSKIRSK